MRRRGLKVLLSEDRGSDLKVRTLYIYDFDDTLVYSPPVKRLRELTKASSIAGKPIKAKPQVRAAYQRAKQDHLGKVIVMTGRLNTPELRKAVKDALDQAGYTGHKFGHDLFLKNPRTRSTAEWKKKMLRGFMKRWPNATSVHMWDDRGEHVEQFKRQIKDLNREPHVVHVSESLYDRIVEALVARVLKGKAGTLVRSKYIHQAVDVGGAIRPACRPRDVSAVLKLSPRLDSTDVTCPRCKKLVESYPNRPRGQARDLSVPSKGEKPSPEAPAEEPEQPMDSALPGNVSPRAFMRGAGTRAQRMRGPRPPR